MYKYANMKKQERLRKIEEIITSNHITSQEQLLQVMEGLGIKCTQATLSRDLRQIGVARFSDSDRPAYYRLIRGSLDSAGKAAEIYQKAIVSLAWAGGLLILKTSPGFAAGVASSVDSSGVSSIAGTVAGDDTILIVPSDGADRNTVMSDLEGIFPGIGNFLPG